MVQGGVRPSIRDLATQSPTALAEWLSDREYEVTRQLERVTLAFEVGLAADDIADFAQAYGIQAARVLRPGLGGSPLLRKYPALTLVTLVDYSAREGKRGDFWEGYWEWLGIPRESRVETDFRQAVPTLVKRFRLASFPQLKGKYIQQIGMQAGIPRHCLRELVDVIADHLRRAGEPSGAALLSWLTDPRKPHRLARVDPAVRMFVTEGGEYAADLVDRIVDLVVTAGDAQVWDGQREVVAATCGLPPTVFGELERLLAGRAGTDELSVTLAVAPSVVLDTVEDVVQFVLPHPPALGGEPWEVALDGETATVATAEPGASTHRPAVHPITSPVRTVTAEHPALDRRYTVSLVDPKDPVVLFTAAGRLVGRQQPVPVGEVYALVPKGHELVDATSGTPVELDLDMGVPAGWFDWGLVKFTAAAGKSLTLSKNGQRVGKPRPVRQAPLPEVLHADALRGVTTAAGEPVHSERPDVWLPADAVGASVVWTVSARRVGQRAWVSSESWRSEAEDASCDPFHAVDGGVVGSFEVVVRGPLGSDLRQVVHLAQDLEAEFTPEFRASDGNGLTVSEAVLHLPEGAKAEPAQLLLGALDAEAPSVVTGCDGGALEVTVRPPHVEIRLDPRGHRPKWTSLPHVATPQELAENRVLAYRVPALADINTWVEVRDRAGATRHQQPPVYREHADAFEVDTQILAQVFDEQALPRNAKLYALVHAPGEDPQAVLLATVRPAELCAGVALDGGALVFEDLAEVAGLTAHVWAESAPWMQPVSLPVRDTATPLPEQLRDAGPLRVRLIVDDPWNPAPVPKWPTPDAARLEQPGWVRSDDPALAALAAYLAGGGELPAGHRPTPHLWSALEAVRARADEQERAALRAGVAALMAAEPRAALEALAHSAVPFADQPALLIESGLVRTQFAGHGGQGEASSNPWVTCMLALADLPRIPAGSDWWADAMEDIEEQGGDSLLRIVQSGRDTDLAKALFDHTTPMLHLMPPAQVDLIFDVARIIPGSLLDVDTRVSAIAEAFAQRQAWVDAPSHTVLIARAKKLVGVVKRVSKHLYDQIALRNEALGNADIVRNPWLMIPMLSLILALLARLDARGAVRGEVWGEELSGAWADLARLCPQLVRADLLIAEGLITHAVMASGPAGSGGR